MTTATWLIVIGIIYILVFIAGIAVLITFFRRNASSVVALIVNDDGSTTKQSFKTAPESFSIGKRRYLFDERAVFRVGMKKWIVYKASVPEPVSIHSVKNPRVVSSTDFQTLIRAEVHRQLFGASAINTVKMLMFIMIGIGVVTLLISLYGAWNAGNADPIVLSGDNVTRQIIIDSVRTAIGR